MKIENVKVGMIVKVKQCCALDAIRGKFAKVIRVRDSDFTAGRKVVELEVDGEIDWVVYSESIKPTLPQYDIPEKAWLLREVFVHGRGLNPSGMFGYIAGVKTWDNCTTLVEFPTFTEGHDGCGEKLLCGWLPESGKTNHWYVSMEDLSFVNKDGSLTPMLEEKV